MYIYIYFLSCFILIFYIYVMCVHLCRYMCIKIWYETASDLSPSSISGMDGTLFFIPAVGSSSFPSSSSSSLLVYDDTAPFPCLPPSTKRLWGKHIVCERVAGDDSVASVISEGLVWPSLSRVLVILTERACVAKRKMGLADWRRCKFDRRAQWKKIYIYNMFFFRKNKHTVSVGQWSEVRTSVQLWDMPITNQPMLRCLGRKMCSLCWKLGAAARDLPVGHWVICRLNSLGFLYFDRIRSAFLGILGIIAQHWRAGHWSMFTNNSEPQSARIPKHHWVDIWAGRKAYTFVGTVTTIEIWHTPRNTFLV